LGLQDTFVMDIAPYPEILEIVGLDAFSIVAAVKSMF
jgi:hypothetical protein